MRYQNWDVLLFPDQSKVPIQEFQTTFHVIFDRQSTISSRKNVPKTLETASGIESTIQVPLLTCFVPSLESGSFFRVSIHSWEKPKPSTILMDCKTAEEVILYEAKVYIDAELVAQRIFGEHTCWPEVFEQVGAQQSTGHAKGLQFPLFHANILEQAHWNAGDEHGRIRIVIAEGVLQQTLHLGLPQRSFDRLRDVIIFSFQHAPKYILEHSRVAWPNAMAFLQAQVAAPAKEASDHEAHAHSPQRSVRHATGRARLPNIPTNLAGPTPNDVMNTWTGKFPARQQAFEDPFLETVHEIDLKNTRNFSTDISMADDASRISKSDMSGVCFHQPDLQSQINQVAVEEIVRALSPVKRDELFNLLHTDAKDLGQQVGEHAKGQKCTSRSDMRKPFNVALQSGKALDDSNQSDDKVVTTSKMTSTPPWDENFTPTQMWRGNEYPGLLSSIKSSVGRKGSDSQSAKRKRKPSAATLDDSSNSRVSDLKGMSTSPEKDSSTPTRDLSRKFGDRSVASSGWDPSHCIE